jgi:ADP-heptose:LPS heptosyltransferase
MRKIMVNTAKLLVYEIILFFSKIKLTQQKKDADTVLLVKTDELGDYILFRNYLPLLIKTLTQNNQKLVFAGNLLWKELFDNLDYNNAIIECIWVNKNLFKKNIYYRYRLLHKLNRMQFSMACNLVVSRSRRTDDAIMAAASTPQRIGYDSDASNMNRLESFFNRSLYNKKIPIPLLSHDFEKHKYFIDALAGRDTAIPLLVLPEVKSSLELPPAPFILLFPGSGKKDKIWQTSKFVQVAGFIHEQYGYTICLAGSKSDAVYADAFTNNFDHPVIDLCGKTNFMQLIELVRNCRFVLSIDTGSVHMAAGTNTACFAVFNGFHYGRFAPYPEYMKKPVYPVYPDDVQKQIESMKLSTGGPIKPGKFNDVPAEKLIEKIKLETGSFKKKD